MRAPGIISKIIKHSRPPNGDYSSFARNLVRFLRAGGDRSVMISPIRRGLGPLEFVFKASGGLDLMTTQQTRSLAIYFVQKKIARVTLSSGTKEEDILELVEAVKSSSAASEELPGYFADKSIEIELVAKNKPASKPITAPLPLEEIAPAPAAKQPAKPVEPKPAAKPVIEPVDYAKLTPEEFFARGKLLRRHSRNNIPPELRPEIELWIKLAKALIEFRNTEIREQGWSQENVGEYNDHYTMATLIKIFQRRLGLNVEEFEIPQYTRWNLKRLDKSHRSTLVRSSSRIERPKDKPDRAEPMDYIRDRCLHLAELIDLHGFENLPQSSKDEYYALMELMRYMLHR